MPRGTWHHLQDSPIKNAYTASNYEELSDKPKLQKSCLVLFESVTVVKEKERLFQIKEDQRRDRTI